MANPYTAQTLLASVQRRGQIPQASDRSYSTDDLLALMSEELQGWLASSIMAEREEFFVRPFDYTTVQGQTDYRVPPRALGSAVRQVLAGTLPNQLVPVTRIEPKQQYGANFGYAMSSGATGSQGGYIFRDTVVQLMNPVQAGQTLRLMIFQRPSVVVADQYYGTITAIGGNTVTLDNVPAGFSASTPLDIVRGTPGFECLAMDQLVSISGNVLTFAALPTDANSIPAVGDFVCLAGQSAVPQIPVEMHSVLAQRTVFKVLESLGDPKAKDAEASAEKAWQKALSQSSPRDEGTARRVINFNGPGWGGRYYGRF